jgi:uncharacterized protein (TIGR02996 family)
MSSTSPYGTVPPEQIRAFLQDCKENPEDDTPRLIFADWLEDRDDPRGPFIRLQCQLARLSDLDTRCIDLRSQEEALRTAHAVNWCDPLKNLPGVLTFERGLLRLRLRQAADQRRLTRGFRASADALAWLEELRLGVAPPTKLMEWLEPIMSHFTSLDLTTPAAEMASLSTSFSPPAASNNGPTEWIVCDQLRHLRRLSLSGRMLQGAGVEALARSSLDNLRELQLAYTGLSDHGAEQLAVAGWLPGLTSLNLKHNHIEDKGLLHLLPRLQASALRRLDLGYNLLTEKGLRWLLAGSSLLGRLETLDLCGNKLCGAGMKALAGVTGPGRLTHLNLSANGLEDDDVVALAGSPLLAQVRTLNLSTNRIGRRGAEALAQSPYLGRLQFLDLGYNELEDAPLVHWISSRSLASLRILHLGNNKIGDAALEGLAEAPVRAPLATLILRRNSIGDRGLTQILRSSLLSQLTYLNLDSNQMRLPGALRMAETEAMRHMRILHINNNEIGDPGALAVAASPYLSGLDHFYIDGNRIVGPGTQALRRRFGSRVDV